MNDQAARHPTDQILRDFGLGRLGDESAEPVHQHLKGCVDCRRRVAEISSDGFLDRLRGARVPSGASPDGIPRPDTAALRAGPPERSGHPDYRIVRELGRGGMGVVYLARNQLMGRDEVLEVGTRCESGKPRPVGKWPSSPAPGDDRP